MLALCAVLGGCARFAPAPPVVSVSAESVLPSDPDAFPWETQTLQAFGSVEDASPSSGAAIPQRALAARNRAKTAAIRDLREQIAQLPVNEEATVGAAMDTVISLKRSIEIAVNRAELAGEEPLAGGGVRVRIDFPLAPVAEVLRQYYITPSEPLPPGLPQSDDALGPLI